MIEMLGVLAIIGVLTVGSITAYSKAMQRHLLNKQRDQYSYILNAFETNYDILDLTVNSTIPNSMKSIFATLGWIPEEMIQDNSTYIYDVFKNSAFLYFIKGSYMYIDIEIGRNAYEQCISFQQLTKQFHSFLYFLEFTNGGSVMNYFFYGDKYCNHRQTNSNCLKDITLSQMSSVCRECKDHKCHILIFWK